MWLDGAAFNGTNGRQNDIAAMAYTSGSSSNPAVRGGVLPSGGTSALLVAAASGMNFTINPGYCVVPTALNSVGAYRFGAYTQSTLTVPPADVVNPRLDLVIAQVIDNGDSTSSALVAIVTGTPAPSPVPPTVPGSSILLAQITVAANVTSIVAGNISDRRVWTVPPGGILPITSAVQAPTGQNGSFVYDLQAARLAHNGASGVKQASLLPWAAQIAVRTTNATSTGTEVTVLSVNIVADGSTDIEVIFKWSNVSDTTGAPPGGAYVRMNLYVDAVRVDQFIVPVPNTTGYGGGTLFYRTTALLSTTPTAGSHAVTWKFQPVSSGTDNVQVTAASGAPAQLVVKPVCL
jgi:hypothetical protein